MLCKIRICNPLFILFRIANPKLLSSGLQIRNDKDNIMVPARLLRASQ